MERLVFWLLKLFFTKFIPFLWRGFLRLVRGLGTSLQSAAPHSHSSAQAEAITAQDLRRDALRTELEGALQLLEELQTKTSALQQRARVQGGPLKVWAEILMTESADLNTLAGTWRELGSSTSSTDALYEAARQELRLHVVRAQVLEYGFEYRTNPVNAAMMADAEAIAQTQLAPLHDFSRTQSIAFASQRPVCFPAEGQESIWFGLLPDQYPVIFVPDDFNEDIFRWPAVAHEVGHLIWRTFPGLKGEMRQVATAQGPITKWDGADDINTAPLFHSWLEEIFCDLVATLQLGPSAVRGMLHLFADDGAYPYGSVQISLDDDGEHLGTHPPPQLRVRLALFLLGEMGFHHQTKQLNEEWESGRESTDFYLLPTQNGDHLEITSETLEGPGRELVRRLYAAELSALRGYRISTLPGFSMSVGLWARVEATAKMLSADRPQAHRPSNTTDARILIAAAIEARQKAPERATQIAARVSHAIVGLDEFRRPELAPTSAAPKAQSEADELKEALVLLDLLAPKTALVRSYSHRR